MHHSIILKLLCSSEELSHPFFFGAWQSLVQRLFLDCPLCFLTCFLTCCSSHLTLLLLFLPPSPLIAAAHLATLARSHLPPSLILLICVQSDESRSLAPFTRSRSPPLCLDMASVTAQPPSEDADNYTSGKLHITSGVVPTSSYQNGIAVGFRQLWTMLKRNTILQVDHQATLLHGSLLLCIISRQAPVCNAHSPLFLSLHVLLCRFAIDDRHLLKPSWALFSSCSSCGSFRKLTPRAN